MLVKNKRVILVDDAAWEQVAGKLKGLFGLQGFELDVYNSCDEFGKFLDAATGSSPADIYVVDIMIPQEIGTKTRKPMIASLLACISLAKFDNDFL